MSYLVFPRVRVQAANMLAASFLRAGRRSSLPMASEKRSAFIWAEGLK